MNTAAKNTKPLLAEAADLLKTTPEKLPARLYGMGYRQTCGRCHGSGAHSFNRQDGAMCYGCSWRGEVAADVTPALIGRIREDVEAGALDHYLDKMRLDAETARAAKNAFKRHLATYGSSETYRYFYDEDGRKINGVNYSALRFAYIDRIHGDTGPGESLATDKWLSPEQRMEALRRTQAYVEAMEAYILVVNAHLAKSIESGLIAQRWAEHDKAISEIKANGDRHFEHQAWRKVSEAQAQQDLADLAPKPTLDLSDLQEIRRARMGSK